MLLVQDCSSQGMLLVVRTFGLSFQGLFRSSCIVHKRRFCILRTRIICFLRFLRLLRSWVLWYNGSILGYRRLLCMNRRRCSLNLCSTYQVLFLRLHPGIVVLRMVVMLGLLLMRFGILTRLFLLLPECI